MLLILIGQDYNVVDDRQLFSTPGDCISTPCFVPRRLHYHRWTDDALHK